jgi:hypothetical protein
VIATFAIDETRRASNIRVRGAGASCVATELAGLRTESPPDVGEVTVTVRLSFR